MVLCWLPRLICCFKPWISKIRVWATHSEKQYIWDMLSISYWLYNVTVFNLIWEAKTRNAVVPAGNWPPNLPSMAISTDGRSFAASGGLIHRTRYPQRSSLMSTSGLRILLVQTNIYGNSLCMVVWQPKMESMNLI